MEIKRCCEKKPLSTTLGYDWVITCRGCRRIVSGKDKFVIIDKWNLEVENAKQSV